MLNIAVIGPSQSGKTSFMGQFEYQWNQNNNMNDKKVQWHRNEYKYMRHFSTMYTPNNNGPILEQNCHAAGAFAHLAGFGKNRQFISNCKVFDCIHSYYKPSENRALHFIDCPGWPSYRKQFLKGLGIADAAILVLDPREEDEDHAVDEVL